MTTHNAIDIRGHRISYYEVGSGAPVIFLHCSSASHKMWLSVAEHLDKKFKIYAPDFYGYGDSAPFASYSSDQVLLDLGAVIALLDKINKKAHIIGHSYGACIALESARRKPEQIASLTLIEPTSFHLLKDSRFQKSWQEAQRFTSRIRQRVQKKKFRSATRVYMKYWIGPIRWFLMPNKAKQSTRSTIEKVAAECIGIDAFNAHIDTLSKIKAPTTLVYGSTTRQTIKDIINLLSETLPHNHTVVLKGAGHLSPFTHTALVHKIITSGLNKYL